MERLKTYVLTLFVVSSIFMSYVLAFKQPDFQPLQQNKDVETTWISDNYNAIELLAPRKVVIHDGNKQVHISYLKQTAYSEVWNKLGQASFLTMRNADYNPDNLDQLRTEARVIECVFETVLPIEAFSDTFQVPPTVSYSDTAMERMLVYLKSGSNTVWALLLNDRDKKVVEASLALSARDFTNLVSSAAKEAGPLYTWSNRGYYLPTKPISAQQLRYPYETVTATQMETSLFIEPGSVRKLLDQNSREIYTDGQRGLKIDRAVKWMTFNNPITNGIPTSDWNSTLNNAVQFVNIHGGWDGMHLLRRIDENGTSSYGFRQYVNAFPVVTSGAMNRDDISLILRNDMVANYERSTTVIQMNEEQSSSAQLPDGAGILARNAAFLANNTVKDIYPVYLKTYVNDTTVAFTPKWAAQLENGQISILN